MSRARQCAFPLLAGLFALVSSGALTGAAAFPGDHAISVSVQTPAATPTAQPRSPSDDDTPWGFFRKNVKHANTLGKWLALIFFTTMLTYMYLPRMVFGIVIVVGMLALIKPQVRSSQLVRIGFGLFAVGFVALNVAGRFNNNPLGFGFLFAFLTPLSAVLMLLGAVKASFKKIDKRLNRDIAALVASADNSRPVWPDDPPLPEVDLVATHGSRAGSALVALLGAEFDGSTRANPGSVHVEQQAALALCRIFSVRPTAGESVPDARSVPPDAGQVSGFWRRKVAATKGRG